MAEFTKFLDDFREAQKKAIELLMTFPQAVKDLQSQLVDTQKAIRDLLGSIETENPMTIITGLAQKQDELVQISMTSMGHLEGCFKTYQEFKEVWLPKIQGYKGSLESIQKTMTPSSSDEERRAVVMLMEELNQLVSSMSTILERLGTSAKDFSLIEETATQIRSHIESVLQMTMGPDEEEEDEEHPAKEGDEESRKSDVPIDADNGENAAHEEESEKKQEQSSDVVANEQKEEEVEEEARNLIEEGKDAVEEAEKLLEECEKAEIQIEKEEGELFDGHEDEDVNEEQENDQNSDSDIFPETIPVAETAEEEEIPEQREPCPDLEHEESVSSSSSSSSEESSSHSCNACERCGNEQEDNEEEAKRECMSAAPQTVPCECEEQQPSQQAGSLQEMASELAEERLKSIRLEEHLSAEQRINDRLRAEYKQMGEARAQAMNRYEEAMSQLQQLKSANDQVEADNAVLRNAVAKLQEEQEAQSKEASEQMTILRERCVALEAEKSELEHSIEEMKSLIVGFDEIKNQLATFAARAQDERNEARQSAALAAAQVSAVAEAASVLSSVLPPSPVYNAASSSGSPTSPQSLPYRPPSYVSDPTGEIAALRRNISALTSALTTVGIDPEQLISRYNAMTQSLPSTSTPVVTGSPVVGQSTHSPVAQREVRPRSPLWRAVRSSAPEPIPESASTGSPSQNLTGFISEHRRQLQELERMLKEASE